MILKIKRSRNKCKRKIRRKRFQITNGVSLTLLEEVQNNLIIIVRRSIIKNIRMKCEDLSKNHVKASILALSLVDGVRLGISIFQK